MSTADTVLLISDFMMKIAVVVYFQTMQTCHPHSSTFCVYAANVTRLTALAVGDEELQESELGVQDQLYHLR